MACSTKSLKIVAIVADIIYALIGALVLGLGIYILWKLDHFDVVAFITIALGVVVLVVATFGLIAAARESSGLSKTYVVILVILIILQLLPIIVSWFFKSTALINVDAKFDQLWRNQSLPVRPENASQIASLERWLECCGSSGSSDYMLPPYSCYTNNQKLNKEGCRQKFLDYVSDRWMAFIIFGLILIAVEVVCAVFAFVLANSIINRWRRSKYYTK